MNAERKDDMDQRRTITTGTDPIGDKNPLEGMLPLDIITGMRNDDWMEDNERYLTPEILADVEPFRRKLDEDEDEL